MAAINVHHLQGNPSADQRAMTLMPERRARSDLDTKGLRCRRSRCNSRCSNPPNDQTTGDMPPKVVKMYTIANGGPLRSRSPLAAEQRHLSMRSTPMKTSWRNLPLLRSLKQVALRDGLCLSVIRVVTVSTLVKSINLSIGIADFPATLLCLRSSQHRSLPRWLPRHKPRSKPMAIRLMPTREPPRTEPERNRSRERISPPWGFHLSRLAGARMQPKTQLRPILSVLILTK